MPVAIRSDYVKKGETLNKNTAKISPKSILKIINDANPMISMLQCGTLDCDPFI